jgi:hypothetical protein
MRQSFSFIDPGFWGRRLPINVHMLCGWLAGALSRPRTARLILGGALAVALLAPLGPLASNRFHRDEAIYSSWGLDIASGRDVLISGSPVDKPPLFPYVQALSFLLFGPTEVAARLPSLMASVASVALVYALGGLLYGRGVGLLAAWLQAASPFAILFAPTAFIDPLMVAWILAGCLLALRGRGGWSGLLLGLASITKQQGVFFLPLAWGLGQLVPVPTIDHDLVLTPADVKSPDHGQKRVPAGHNSAHRRFRSIPFLVAFAGVFGLALIWDAARARQPGFLAQGWLSYGGLSLSLAATWERVVGFLDLLRYSTGAPVLNLVLLGGLPLLLIADVAFLSRHVVPRLHKRFAYWRSIAFNLPDRSIADGQGSELRLSLGCQGRGAYVAAWADVLAFGFIALFLLGHSLVAFAVWDRYLLGLIPWLVLLLARVLTLPRRFLKHQPVPNVLSSLFVLGLLAFTLGPVRDAAASRFPVGGDHGAYQGIEQVVNYLETVPAGTTVYHRWLGWHWRFYLWGSSYDFRNWTSPSDLAAQAAARPGARRVVVFPSWRSPTEARLALADAGLTMREVQRSFRDDGSVSFVVYLIEEVP